MPRKFGLKQEAPEEQDAQQQDQCDDDDLNQAHNRFLKGQGLTSAINELRSILVSLH